MNKEELINIETEHTTTQKKMAQMGAVDLQRSIDTLMSQDLFKIELFGNSNLGLKIALILPADNTRGIVVGMQSPTYFPLVVMHTLGSEEWLVGREVTLAYSNDALRAMVMLAANLDLPEEGGLGIDLLRSFFISANDTFDYLNWLLEDNEVLGELDKSLPTEELKVKVKTLAFKKLNEYLTLVKPNTTGANNA